MAREVVTQVWCDPCLHQDIHEPAVAQEVPVQFLLGTSRTPWELDTCEVHFKELVQPVVDALQEFGIKVDTASRMARSKTDPETCLDCGGTYKNAGSFNAHVRQQHDYAGIKEYRARWGTAPAAPVATPSTPGDRVTITEGKVKVVHTPTEDEVKCDQPGCGKVYSHALGNNRPKQALGVHLALKHGIRSKARTAA